MRLWWAVVTRAVRVVVAAEDEEGARDAANDAESYGEIEEDEELVSIELDGEIATRAQAGGILGVIPYAERHQAARGEQTVAEILTEQGDEREAEERARRAVFDQTAELFDQTAEGGAP